MKVYIPILDYDYEGYTMLGVFSTEELAKEALKTNGFWISSTGRTVQRGDKHRVVSFTLDIPEEY